MFEDTTINPCPKNILSLLLIFMYKVIEIISDKELSVIPGKVEFEEDTEMHLWNDQVFRQQSLCQQLSHIRIGDTDVENLIKKDMEESAMVTTKTKNFLFGSGTVTYCTSPPKTSALLNSRSITLLSKASSVIPTTLLV